MKTTATSTDNRPLLSLSGPVVEALRERAQDESVPAEDLVATIVRKYLRPRPRKAENRRSRIVAARVTAAQYDRLAQLAEARGMALSEWTRDAVLAAGDPERRALVFELVAVRQILVALILYLGTDGAAITIEQLRAVQREADEKAKARALKLLAKAVANEPEYLAVEPGQVPTSKEHKSHVQ